MKIFNTINFKRSMHYNPFAYVQDEKDILKLVTTLLEMINAMEVREDDEEFKNPVDLMFDELAEREPDQLVFMRV